MSKIYAIIAIADKIHQYHLIFIYLFRRECRRIRLEIIKLELKMTLGQRIKQLRVDKELNQPELAGAMGIEQSYLSKLENNKAFPSDEMFEKLLTALKMTVDDFIKGFDRTYIINHLSKLSFVKQHTEALTQSNAKYLFKWIIVSSLMIAFGITLYMAGEKSWADASEFRAYYKSMGVVKKDEPLLLFEQDPERLPNDILARVSPETVHLSQKNGDFFVKPVEGGSRYYEYIRGGYTRSKSLNNWLRIVGMFIGVLGVVGLLIEPKIRRLRSIG